MMSYAPRYAFMLAINPAQLLTFRRPRYIIFPAKGNVFYKTPKTSIIRSKNHDQRHGYEEGRKEGTCKKPEGKKSREET